MVLGVLGACATNPATGKKELMLVSEGQEIALGQQEDKKAVASFGAYDDPAERVRCAERFPEIPAWKRRDPQIPKSRWWITDAPHVGFRLESPAETYSMEEIRAYFTDLLGG